MRITFEPLRSNLKDFFSVLVDGERVATIYFIVKKRMRGMSDVYDWVSVGFIKNDATGVGIKLHGPVYMSLENVQFDIDNLLIVIGAL